ncbi:MAG: hypothetical protein A3G37_01200 [Omnitrophica WOR_2 bacterium RIFCSPLOWO2_12_FULL_46_30]|nr:MAG: hypothetical protein A3D27_02790 [Omnitrophica WOR_2 bacterium RIFCSPHIGHO2_02_FULL_46_37]OGX42155.1 MAG: hypothetical protein A3H41_01810 [Omnitrophica WOR_2 bacterium RIFCSPLOWO2_02_FULL_45_28]OGX50028.1 MAG: hypothetical protein A3G37_01200 [Omnitrophica WOR_2 bacterium RIFCSPLOWO2_12_FULL_46_30]
MFRFAQQNKAGGAAKNLSQFLSELQIFLDRFFFYSIIENEFQFQEEPYRTITFHDFSRQKGRDPNLSGQWLGKRFYLRPR